MAERPGSEKNERLEAECHKAEEKAHLDVDRGQKAERAQPETDLGQSEQEERIERDQRARAAIEIRECQEKERPDAQRDEQKERLGTQHSRQVKTGETSAGSRHLKLLRLMDRYSWVLLPYR